MDEKEAHERRVRAAKNLLEYAKEVEQGAEDLANLADTLKREAKALLERIEDLPPSNSPLGGGRMGGR